MFDKKSWTVSKKAIILLFRQATVAQLVEHLTRNEDVCGSIPHGGSKKYSHQMRFLKSLYHS